jgi:carbon-monoxide dehydrogenase large subunit
VTLARQSTAVKRLGGKGAGQAGCIAAPQTLINAILASLSIDHTDMSDTPIACGARSPARGR